MSVFVFQGPLKDHLVLPRFLSGTVAWPGWRCNCHDICETNCPLVLKPFLLKPNIYLKNKILLKIRLGENWELLVLVLDELFPNI